MQCKMAVSLILLLFNLHAMGCLELAGPDIQDEESIEGNEINWGFILGLTRQDLYFFPEDDSLPSLPADSGDNLHETGQVHTKKTVSNKRKANHLKAFLDQSYQTNRPVSRKKPNALKRYETLKFSGYDFPVTPIAYEQYMSGTLPLPPSSIPENLKTLKKLHITPTNK